MTYSYDANNKLTQLVGPSGTTTFGYDSNGNMTGMNLPDETVWNYGYDYENRLVGVTDNEDYTAAYTYGSDGLRLRVQESNNPNPDRWFQYDGVRPVLEGTLADDTFTTVNRYVWEGDTYYSPLIYADFDDQTRYFLYDGLGSTRQLLDSDEDVTDTYSYEAFGNIISDGGPTPNPYQYVGSLGYYATGSSLLHLGARYYMPEVGRFVHSAFFPQGVRDPEYGYGRASPANHVDPKGYRADSGEPWSRGKCIKDCHDFVMCDLPFYGILDAYFKGIQSRWAYLFCAMLCKPPHTCEEPSSAWDCVGCSSPKKKGDCCEIFYTRGSFLWRNCLTLEGHDPGPL